MSFIQNAGGGQRFLLCVSERQTQAWRCVLRLDKLELRARRDLTEKQRHWLQRHVTYLEIEERAPVMRGPARGMRFFIRIVSPDTTALQFLSERDMVPITAEISLDLLTADYVESAALTDFFDQHFIQKWHGKRRIRQTGEGTYTGPKKSHRIFTWYGSRPLKGTKLPCFHLECRLKGAQALQAVGIEKCSDLLSFNHQKFWQKNLNMREVDFKLLGEWYGKHHATPDHSDLYDVSRRIGSMIFRAHAARSEDEDFWKDKKGIKRLLDEDRETHLMQHFADVYEGVFMRKIGWKFRTTF